MYYIIDKKRIMVSAQHETEGLCRQHIRNAASLFGNEPSNYFIANGAKERDAKLKELKHDAAHPQR